MRLAGILDDDVVNGKGVCLSVWPQGCPHRCPGCHNPHTWRFDGGTFVPLAQLIQYVADHIDAYGIHRNLSILGGEPLCQQNAEEVYRLCEWFKSNYPDRKIYLWTGYTIEELNEMGGYPADVLGFVDVLIEGRFKIDQRDYSLPLRGSSNQRVIEIEHFV